MPPVPVLKPKEVVKAFGKLGWEVARQKGSHIILTKEGHITTLSVPNPQVGCSRHLAQPHCQSMKICGAVPGGIRKVTQKLFRRAKD